MSQTITLTDEQYAILAWAGAADGRAPEVVIVTWIETLRGRYPHVYRVRRVEGDPDATQPAARQPHAAAPRR